MTKEEYKSLKIGDKLTYTTINFNFEVETKKATVIKNYSNWQIMIRLEGGNYNFPVGYTRVELIK